jgi:hypothetical protein
VAEAIETRRLLAFWEELPDDLVELFSNSAQLDAFAARMREIAMPDLVCVMDGGEIAVATEYRGVEGLGEAWSDWLEPWESYRLQIEDVVQGEGVVVIPVRVEARTKTDRVEVRHAPAAVCVLRGDRLARVEFHLDRRRAFEVAGLPQPGS